MEAQQGLVWAVVGLITSLLLVPAARPLWGRLTARTRAEWHQAGEGASIPRIGGLALIGAFCILGLTGYFWGPNVGLSVPALTALLTGCVALFAVGFYDDLKPLGARKKLAAQLIVAVGAWLGGIHINSLENPLTGATYDLGWLGLVATVFWLVALTNLINLIDGLDGLAGGIALMIMGLLAYMSVGGNFDFATLLAFGMAGALIGFLAFNFPPARIYLGDGGAYFLGFLIAALAIVHSHKGTVAAAMVAPTLALALPIVDVTFAILRRGIKGLPFFRPDQRHIHHRLMEAGLSRRRVVLLLYAVSTLCLIAAFVAFAWQGKLLAVLAGVLVVGLLAFIRSAGIVENWLKVSRQVYDALHYRRKTQHIVSLGQWLSKEAQEADSVPTLWSRFQIMVYLMGFSRAKLALEDEVRTWENKEQVKEGKGLSGEMHHERHKLDTITPMALDLEADKAQMSEKCFEVWSDVAAETWHKMAQEWESSHGRRVQFDAARAPSETKAAEGHKGVKK